MAKLRPFNTIHQVDLFAEATLPTSNERDNELWTLLKMQSQVPSVGKSTLNRLGTTTDQTKVLKRYGAFIRQAHNYWESAEKTHFSSSPLLYYYCFLNLVKAVLVLHKPNLAAKIDHGVSFPNRQLPNRSFKDLEITVNRGVFPFYHELTYSDHPPKYNVVDILSYIQEGSLQFQAARLGAIRVSGFICKIVADQTNRWVTLAFRCDKQFHQLLKGLGFLNDYELVDQFVPTLFHDQAFDLTSRAVGENFYLYQSRDESLQDNNKPIQVLQHTTHAKFGDLISRNIYNNSDSAVLNIPKKHCPNFHLNEEYAIYLTMFLLSNLVRYNPDYMEKLLGQKAGWYLESIMKSTPQRFLMFIVARVYDRTLKIQSS